MSNKFCRDIEIKTLFYICKWRKLRQNLLYIHACFIEGEGGVVSPNRKTTSCEGHQGWAQEEERVVGFESPQDRHSNPC